MRQVLAILVAMCVGPPALAVPDAEALSDAVASLAERATPAVVLVEVARRRALAPELLEVLIEAGVQAGPGGSRSGDASGSGVILSSQGRVVTNAHVVGGAISVTVVTADERRLPARVVAVDPRTDLAVLQLEPEGPYPFLTLGDSAGVRVGDVVMAIGSPFEFQSSVTLGIVSATGRRGLDAREIQDYLQTDAAVNPGSSGGPLLDTRGRVVGINTAIFSPSVDQNSGISFAIPADLVRRVMAELDGQGRVPVSWVGLVATSVTAVDGDATLRGAEVLRVVPDGPAARAGMRRGDIVVAVDGEPIGAREALESVVLVREVGSTLVITVTRDGRRVPLSVVTAEERSVGIGLEDLPADALYWHGMYLADPDDRLRAHFGVGQERGLLVVRVDPETPAARLGVKTGDLVVEVSGTPVKGLDPVREQLAAPGRGVIVTALQRAGTRIHAVLPAPP